MSDVAQLPTPTMATRSFAISISLVGARARRGRLVLTAVGGSFVFNELVEPCDLAFHLLQAVALQFSGVRVVAIALAARRCSHLVEPLGQAGAAALEDPKSRRR